MPEEQIKEPEVKETVTDKVTDAQLDSASELFTDEKVESKVEVKPEAKEEPIEVVKTKEQLDEEEEHRERSRLGRRLKSMEDKQAERERLDEERWARIEAKLSQPTVTRETIVEDDLPEIISTPEDVRKVNRYDKEKEMREYEKYALGYIKTAKVLGVEHPELHDEVMGLITGDGSPFNQRQTGNPGVDAELNYSKAKAAVLSKKIAAPSKSKPNVRSEPITSPTNLSVDSKSEPSLKAEVQLDDDAKEFIKRIGKDQSWATDALKGETPIHLSGRR